MTELETYTVSWPKGPKGQERRFSLPSGAAAVVIGGAAVQLELTAEDADALSRKVKVVRTKAAAKAADKEG